MKTNQKNKAMSYGKQAFTLIEIMVAIAIVAILTMVVLAQFQRYAKGARASKALAQLSSAIPLMVSCWGNTGTVNSPSSGGYICKINGSDVPSYGQWPYTAGDLVDYSYGGTTTNKANWFVVIANSSDSKKICCNSVMSNCKILDNYTDSCDASNPPY